MDRIGSLPPETPEDRPQRAGVAAPDAQALADEARWLAEPPLAVVAVVPWHGGLGEGLLVSPAGVSRDHGALIRSWLGSVTRSGPVRVPDALCVAFAGSRALAVPLRTPVWTVGALALPLRSGWGPLARELELLGADFALRLEAADRRAQLALLRAASVGPRPAAHRTAERRPVRPAQSAPGSVPPPRPRFALDEIGRGRVEPVPLPASAPREAPTARR